MDNFWEFSLNNCIVCGSKDIKKIYHQFQGYVEGKYYEIFKCNNCFSHFIDPKKIDINLYSIIYNEENILGYDRYLKYAKEIINHSDPLKYLADQESTYYPVYKYLKGKNKLKILELGCGYGYLTYAMYKSGHNCFGIDLSRRAISFAKSNYGNYFENISIEDLVRSSSEKFDLVVATEVVEHLFDIPLFLENLKKIITPNGKILLTTPNKDFVPRNYIWLTDLPPVHVTWLGKKSFKVLANQKNFDIDFITFNKHYPPKENKIIKYLRFQKDIIPSPSFDANGKVLKTADQFYSNPVREIIKWFVHVFAPIRILSNLIFNLFNNEDNTLAVLLKPKNTT